MDKTFSILIDSVSRFEAGTAGGFWLDMPATKEHFFPNTHEALIDEETFDLAQKRIATKTRPTKVDEIDIFRDFCFAEIAATKCILCAGRKHPNANTLILAGIIATEQETILFAQRITYVKVFYPKSCLPICKEFFPM